MNKPTFDAMLAQYEVKEASGAGEVSWENGVHCEIPEVVIGGKAEQVTYTGKNLFDADAFFEFFATLPLKHPGNEMQRVTEDGRKCFYFNPRSGQIADDVELPKDSGGMAIMSLNLKPNTQYTLRLIGKQGATTEQFTTGLAIRHEDGTTTAANIALSTDWTEVVATVPNGKTVVGLRLTYNVSANVYIDIDSIQLEEGTIATEYEPYTGGIPAPNPWYPIEPVFSSNTKIKSRSKNVLDFMSVLGEGYTNTLDGVTVTVENGWAIFKGEHTVEKWSNVLNFYITPDLRPKFILPAGTYTTPKNLIPNATGLTLQLYDMATNTSLGNKSETFTLKGDAYLTGFYAAFQTVMPVDCKIPLTVFRGDVAPTEYVSYFDGGEADVPELLSVLYDYQDLWNPQTGIKEKVIEVLSFSGEENWYSYNNTSVALGHWANDKDKQASYNEPIGYICTHAIQSNNGNPDQNDYTFVTHCDKSSNNNWIVFHCNMSLQEWKDFLASEYSKGTPVTVWYVLAKPETIQTTFQPLIQPKGTCEIIQTEGTVSGCPISAKYLAHK